MSHSHYEKLVEAAEALKKEVGFFSDDSVEDDDYVGDVGREIWFLNLSLEYFYSKGIYPFGTTNCAIDFSDNWLNMCVADYLDENRALKKRYKKRVRTVCKKGQLLNPSEQEAFDFANKLWGSQSGCRREEHQQDHMLLEETYVYHTNIPHELNIPVTSDALAFKEWNIQVQELKILLDKLTLVHHDITQFVAKIDQ
ncbi:hypothetical protein VNO78_13736 [Psophocarpus tetragonolobus]|uniref:Uncharacterized protein n=1 Tax=Psophocarpus tetragonolobus TaxID=3891 RepID=A0AAN9XQ11_PSOTE